MASNCNNLTLNDDNTVRDVTQTIIQENTGPIYVTKTDSSADEQCKRDYHLKLTIDGVKEKLIQTNKDLKLPITPWLGDEKHKLLIKDYFVQLELRGTKKKIIPLEKIFIEERTTEEIKRIYIEALPGFGKTTLTYKLATDWVTNEEYIKKFDLAFLVVLKYLQGISVKTMLSEIVDHEDKDELWELINNEKTLIILDGLDEIGDEAKCEIKDLKFRGTIVITGRTGSHNFDSRDTIEYYKGLEKSNIITGRYITISGIVRKNRVDFLDKFFHDSENWEKIKNKIDKLTVSLDEMFKSPLMLILLVYVLNEKLELNIEDESIMLYKTDLYKNLINFSIIRSLTKTNKNVKSTFDLFSDEKAPSDEIVETFHNFGSIALKNLECNNLQFQSNGIVEKIYQLGFLLKHEITTKIKTRVHFEGLHLSIIEFAAAISFWLYHKKNSKFTNNQLIRIRNLIVNKGERSLVVPFLSGLMGKKVKELFIELQPHYGFFICKDISFLLRECEMDDLLGEAILPLLSNYLCFYNKPSFETLQLMNCGVKYQKLKFISTAFGLLEYLPTNLDGVTLWVMCGNDSKFVKVIKELKCKKLIFKFSHNLEKFREIGCKIILKTFNNIDCETKRLEIHSDPEMLLNLLLTEETKITRIDELQFGWNFVSDKNELSSFEEIFSFFIEHCQVRSFECFNNFYYPLSNTVKSMSKSSFLKAIHTVGTRNNFDYKLIGDICQNVGFDQSICTGSFYTNPSIIEQTTLVHKENNEIDESLFHKNKVWCNKCKLTFDPNTLIQISLLKSQVLKPTTDLDKVIELKLNYDAGTFLNTVKSCKHIRIITLSFDTIEKLDDFFQKFGNIGKAEFSKLNLIIEISLNFFENLDWVKTFENTMSNISLVETLVLKSVQPKKDIKEIDKVSTLKYYLLFLDLEQIFLGAIDTVLIDIYGNLLDLPLDVNCMFSNFDKTKLQCECTKISYNSMSFKITCLRDSSTIKDFCQWQ